MCTHIYHVQINITSHVYSLQIDNYWYESAHMNMQDYRKIYVTVLFHADKSLNKSAICLLKKVLAAVERLTNFSEHYYLTSFV